MSQNKEQAPASELTTDKERALVRIKKLLTIAEGNAENGESERDTAMRMALKLLAMHNLEMTDVRSKKEERMTAELETYTCPWRRTVAGAISALFFSTYFYTGIKGKQKHKFTFIGLESNVITARDMTEWVIKSVTKECLKKKRELGENAAWETSFFNAAAYTISRRCREMRAEAEVENIPKSGSTALALTSIYEQEEKANLAHIAQDMGIELKTKSIKLAVKSASGSAAGREYGNNINLGKQITGGATKPKAAIK